MKQKAIFNQDNNAWTKILEKEKLKLDELSSQESLINNSQRRLVF